MPSRIARLLLVFAIVSASVSALYGATTLAQDNTILRVAAGGAPPPGSGPMDTAGFVRAIDGDTMETEFDTNRVGIGIIGIDAPEGNTICGVQATGYLQGLVYGGLHFEEDADIHFDDTDRRMYYAYLPTGESVAELMVAAGMARATGEGIESEALLNLQAEAEATGTGCFADPDANLNVYGTPEEVMQSSGISLLQASSLPGELTQEVVASNLNFPASFAFFPDGRILIGEKSGLVRVVADGQILPTPFIDIRSIVNDYWDRGLLNVAVDPDFDANGYVYLLFTWENNPAHYSGPKTARMIRVTASGDTASMSTAVTMLGSVVGASCTAFPHTADCIPSDAASHSAGGIAFGNDGSIFVTLGDGAGFNVVDPNALRAQHPESLGGKMLRITNAGQGLPDNPFFTGNPNDNRSKIWASGMRNAFRLTVNPASGTPIVGDVGWNTWEEVSVAPAGANLGWPCYEGPARQGGYEPLATCQSLYAAGSSAVQMPIIYWNHNGAGSSVTGGVFMTNESYPEPYRNAYVYSDYVAGTIYFAHIDGNNQLTREPELLTAQGDGPVDFKLSPEGYMHYLSINTGQIRRVLPVGAQPPDVLDPFISDLPWISEENGWGPAERDMSNGEDAAGDGNPLTIRGNVYDKGIGVHGHSEIEVDIVGLCPVFTAAIGIDDEVAPNGTVEFQVYGDDMPMYESGVLTGTDAPVDVRVDLTGHSVMRLVVTEGGDNNWWDHANWANARMECESEPPPPPPPPPPGDPLYISDMVWESESNGWGPVERDMSNGEEGAGDGNPLTIRGTVYEKGIGVHPPDAEIVVAIPESCTIFSAWVGIDDEVAPNGSVEFLVYGDDMLMYQSGVRTGTDEPVHALVDLAGHSMMRLVVTDGGDNNWWDHGNWADAHFICEGEVPDELQVISTSPANGATDVAVASIIAATLSHDIDAATVTGTTATLTGPEGAVDATVSYLADDRKIHISPTGTLAPGTTYTATIAGGESGVLTGDGMALASDYTWSFTTAASTALPTAEITSFDPDYRFVVGDEIEFAGVGTDSDGNPIPASGMSWRVLIHHCSPFDCHMHQLFNRSGIDSGVIEVPDHGIDPWYIEVILTVTQAGGAQAVTAVEIEPLFVTVTLESSPPGINVSFGAIDGPAPLTRDIVAGSAFTVQTASPQGDYTFESWSDGGSQQHDVTLGTSDLTLTAVFSDSSEPPPPPPPPPGEDVYISDIPWISEVNGWGPAERDMSNGEEFAGDGNPLTMGGVVYEKGLGVHAPSEIIVDISELCPTFIAVIGIDDEVGDNGAVTFEVWGDTTRLYQSGVMTGAMPGQEITVDLTGYNTLRLVVDEGDINWWDHANWADARLVCSDEEPPPPPPPPPPDGEDHFVSDLAWASESNGWGPAERDMSNGEQPGGDGLPLTMAGIVYEKGIGAHAFSEIVIDIVGLCPYFHAIIGVDDEVGSSGSITFEVYGGSSLLYQSGVMTGAMAGEQITVDLTGHATMRLVITDAGDGVAYDHGNWANALLSCDATPPTPPTDPDPDPDPDPPPPAGLFAAPTSYSTGTNSHGVIGADVTGNGALDMLVANAGSNTVTVYPGTGGGAFGNPTSWNVGGLAPKMVTVGDLNNNGILDMVTANQDSDGVGIMLGTGGGSFAPAVQIPSCSRAHEVVLGDLDGDGNLDIVTACWNDDHITVHLGNGDGTFQDPVPYMTWAVSHSVQIADFNGDGIPDLVVDDYWGWRVHIFLGNGDGTFGSSTTFGVGAGPHGVRVADLNGDGRMDIVTANDLAGTVSVLLGNGNGTFQSQSVHTVNPNPKSVALGDVSGDGQIDIVVANSWGNYGASTFVPTDISVLRGTGGGSFAAAEHYPIDMTPFSVTIADFNGDGRNDVAVALWHSGTAAVFLNAGN